MSHFIRFTLYPIEPAKESGTANTTEGYNIDKLTYGNIRYDFYSYVIDHVNVGHLEIQFLNDIIQTMVTSSIFLTVNIKYYLPHTYTLLTSNNPHKNF